MLLVLLVDSLYLVKLLLLHFDFPRLVLLALVRGALRPIVENHLVHFFLIVIVVVILTKFSSSTR